MKSDYTPWLQERKSDINFYYWNRLRNYLLGEQILPPNVLSRLDALSDEISISAGTLTTTVLGQGRAW